ncbi:hypothetical protein IHE44_0014156, partial [Lamprotornis superbus]
VLRCLDPHECGGSVVKVSSRYLQSECRERRCLALRALLELIDDPSMVRRGQWLKLNWEKQPLGLRVLGQLLPALLPPCSAARAKKMCSLTESLMDLLRDKDAEIVGMTLITISFIFMHKYILIPSPIALQLAEALLPFLDA